MEFGIPGPGVEVETTDTGKKGHGVAQGYGAPVLLAREQPQAICLRRTADEEQSKQIRDA